LYVHIVNYREKDAEVESAHKEASKHEEATKIDESTDKPELERPDSRMTEDSMVSYTHGQTDNLMCLHF